METIFGVFAKQPIPGRVKTRLAADIGPEAAATLYEAFLSDIVEQFRDTADVRVLGFSPDDAVAEAFFQSLSEGQFDLWAQPNTSLGDRMAAFFDEHQNAASRVVLIGSDSPTLPMTVVDEAFAALESHDCVIGPALDGGYYLIGLSRRADGLFEDVVWDGPRVLEQTVRNINSQELSLHILTPWYDVDTLEDLNGLRGHLAALHAAGKRNVSPRTWQALQQICTNESGQTDECHEDERL